MTIHHGPRLLLIAAALAVPFSTQAITTTGQYTVTILGRVQHNYPNSAIFAFSMNDTGQVAGYATVRVADNFSRVERGVIWQSSEPHYTILGTISEGITLDSVVYCINNSGVAVGESFENTKSGGHEVPVMFTPNGIVDLGVKNATSGYATGINNAGQVVGDLLYYTPFEAIQAFLYQNGVMTLLGYPVPTIGYSQALAINDNGVVVGAAQFARHVARHAASYANGAWTDLGAIGPSSTFEAFATSVNDSGVIVGVWQNGNQGGVFIYQNGQISDLQAPNRPGEPHINNAGQIVYGDFIYQNGGWQDINDLDLGDGWKFWVAYGINNHGTILGTMFRVSNGVTINRFGLLTPVSSNPAQLSRTP
jgi:probable HAF family extracellular repeat protein